jgi:hypothetical protein
MKTSEWLKIFHPNIFLPDIRLIDGRFPYKSPSIRISFKKLIKSIFIDTIFIDKFQRNLIDEYLELKFNGYHKKEKIYNFLLRNNLLPSQREISIKDLCFYQDEIRLDNLDKIEDNILYNEEPVIVINYKEKLILFDGYHRTTIKIMSGIETIYCYLI